MLEKPIALAVGNFDGVHLGHQHLLNTLILKAKEKNLIPSVLMFNPHPLEVLEKESAPCIISTVEERKEYMYNLGIENVFVINFTKEFSNIPARDFIKEYVYEKLNTKLLIVGYDWRYGAKREGEFELAKEMGQTLGFEVIPSEPYKVDGHIVSSTLIRRLLKEANLDDVKKYLGRDYSIKRKVVRGKGLGSKIGFPTANISNTSNMCLKEGVYAVKVNNYLGVANYGKRPTVENTNQNILEVHIIDFNGDLVDNVLNITFLGFLREEKKFNSIEELKTQIKTDIETAKALFSNKSV
ncbi:MAG: bifunctional riboflavin kinase/FAD synthetase [Hydrogenobaculum sp.]